MVMLDIFMHTPVIHPKSKTTVNPIGAGDCCSAVTLSAMLSSREDEDEEVAAARAFRLGLAAATASCCKEENSTYDLDALWAVAAAIRVEVRVE